MMLQNKQSSPNTPPFPEVQPPSIVIDLPEPPEQESELVSLEEDAD
jgi:hypothetical protein